MTKKKPQDVPGRPPEGVDIPEPEEWSKEPDLAEDEIEVEDFDVDEGYLLVGGEDHEEWEEDQP